MSRIVAIGEAMVELAPAERAGEFAMGFAGDTLNTAWYLRRLLPPESRIDYLTAVGEDAISGQMLAFLAAEGLGIGHVAQRRDRTVGLYMIQLQDGERSFSYWRSDSAARTLARDPDRLRQALSGARLAYFSGITLAILPPADRAALLDALRDFRATGAEVVFDPNLRPRLWSDPAEMTASIMQAAAASDIVLPSHEDEATWFGDADTLATARRYESCGAGEVVVKNGAGQMLALVDGHISLHHSHPVPQVVDTTAAGDSFNAGYLAGRAKGYATATCIDMAAALAARVIQSRGALVAVI